MKYRILTGEDAEPSTTVAGDIASTDVPLSPKKKKKKKKQIKETATPGSTNVADFSNAFGTDSPRLPSELGSLGKRKSMGMGGGFTKYNLKVTDPFTGETFELLKTLNNHGKNHPGGSTTQPPVVRSPYNEFIGDGQFKFSDDGKRRKAAISEKNTKKEHRKLRKLLQQAFIDSITKPADSSKTELTKQAMAALNKQPKD